VAHPPADDDPTPLRHAVLAAAVLHEIDLRPAAGGVELAGRTAGRSAVLVPWRLLAAVAGSGAPEPEVAARVAALLLVCEALLEQGTPAPDGSGVPAVACALPVGHVLHPGPAWVRFRVPGGVLDLGAGLRPAPGAAAIPVPPVLVARPPAPELAVEADVLWPRLRARHEQAGAVAADRLRTPLAEAVLRPVAGHDVPTLLATTAVRRALAASDGTGLRAVAVPSRDRGWFDDRRVDVAFVAAAWSITAEHNQGFPAPLLVTRDEVCLARPGAALSR
jgi:hypothetical protein